MTSSRFCVSAQGDVSGFGRRLSRVHGSFTVLMPRRSKERRPRDGLPRLEWERGSAMGALPGNRIAEGMALRRQMVMRGRCQLPASVHTSSESAPVWNRIRCPCTVSSHEWRSSFITASRTPYAGYSSGKGPRRHMPRSRGRETASGQVACHGARIRCSLGPASHSPCLGIGNPL